MPKKTEHEEPQAAAPEAKPSPLMTHKHGGKVHVYRVKQTPKKP
jgi:hypothetical protein